MAIAKPKGLNSFVKNALKQNERTLYAGGSDEKPIRDAAHCLHELSRLAADQIAARHMEEMHQQVDARLTPRSLLTPKVRAVRMDKSEEMHQQVERRTPQVRAVRMDKSHQEKQQPKTNPEGAYDEGNAACGIMPSLGAGSLPNQTAIEYPQVDKELNLSTAQLNGNADKEPTPLMRATSIRTRHLELQQQEMQRRKPCIIGPTFHWKSFSFGQLAQPESPTSSKGSLFGSWFASKDQENKENKEKCTDRDINLGLEAIEEFKGADEDEPKDECDVQLYKSTPKMTEAEREAEEQRREQELQVLHRNAAIAQRVAAMKVVHWPVPGAKSGKEAGSVSDYVGYCKSVVSDMLYTKPVVKESGVFING